MKEYSFGLPGIVIWLFHILFGSFLAYLGYQLIQNQPIDRKIALLLVVMGSLSALYHGHIWLTHQDDQN